MKRIVIGVDGSESGARAAQWGAGLARASGAEVVVATSFVRDLASVSSRAWVDEVAHLTRVFTDEWCEPLRAAGVEFEPRVLEHLPPAHGLQVCGDDAEADLLVIGARGSGGFAGLVLGSVADHLAHTCNRPLAVVPAGVDVQPIDRVLVGIDASAGSAAAAEWTGALAADLGAAVSAVHVTFLAPHSIPDDDPRSPVRMLAGRWTEGLVAHGIEAECGVISSDHAASALLGAARADGADLVVVGTRASKLPLHPRLGGASMQLLHESTDLPVVIVPPNG